MLLATFLVLTVIAVGCSLVPVLPGPPFAVVGLMLIPLWPWHEASVDELTWWVAGGTAALGMLISIIDFAAPMLAKVFEGAFGKSSKAAGIGSVLGLMCGVLVSFLLGCLGLAIPLLGALPVPLILVTPFLGAMSGEYFHKVEGPETGTETLVRCMRSALVQWLGLVTTILLKAGYCLLTIPIGVWLILRMM